MQKLCARVLVGAWLAVSTPLATAYAAPPSALQAKLDEVVQKAGAPGVTALVFRDGRELYHASSGIAPTRPIPIASASKWMTATLVMTVVDEGKVALDDPIVRWIPELSPQVGAITLRQILSFTSGQGELTPMADLRQDVGISLQEGALAIGRRPLEDPPGTVFKYGSGAMQLAGLVVERATGSTWSDLFNNRIAAPLGLSDTHWGNPLQPAALPKDVRNPNLQGGVYTTADDYGRFLTMIASRGRYSGGRILSEKAFAAMESVQTLQTPRVFVPPGALASFHYAIGHWCETLDAANRCVMVSSPGAFGVYPWIDRASGTYGLFFLKHRLRDVAKPLREARDIILADVGR